jgi:ABC-type multidrug transport system ATPase subunit
VLSSHLVSDLERVCDHLILLAGSRVQLAGDIDTLLAEHKVLVGPGNDTAAYQGGAVTLESLVLAYMGADEASAGDHLTTVGEDS